MKKLFYQLLLITAGDFQLHAQNIVIGTTTPTRGKLEVVGGSGTVVLQPFLAAAELVFLFSPFGPPLALTSTGITHLVTANT
jgi:hypothetical protein